MSSRLRLASPLRRFGAVAAAVLAPALLCGCGILTGVTSAAVGASTGAATANPVVGYAVAVGTNAALDELQNYIARVRENATQDAIVETAGAMHPGETRPWKIVHDIPEFDNAHGTMQVTRTIVTPIADCKEVLFTVDHGTGAKLRQLGYVTSACRDTRGWKWAGAEPATERWGFYQHLSH